MRDLTLRDWRLLAVASLVQVMTAAGLRVMSLPRLRRAASHLRLTVRRGLRGSDERVIWAIEASGRRLGPASTCLVRALVAELALSTPERPLRLTLGVKRTEGGHIESHAWLTDEAERRVLIGGAESGEFTPLASTDGVVA